MRPQTTDSQAISYGHSLMRRKRPDLRLTPDSGDDSPGPARGGPAPSASPSRPRRGARTSATCAGDGRLALALLRRRRARPRERSPRSGGRRGASSGHRCQSPEARVARPGGRVGLGVESYVELLGTVVALVSIDSFCLALGLPEHPLPAPVAGEPSRYHPPARGKRKRGCRWCPRTTPARRKPICGRQVESVGSSAP